VPFIVPLAEPTTTGPLGGNVSGPVNSPGNGPANGISGGLHGAGTAAGVISAIRNASARTGMNFDLMLASASLESGLDPSAQAGTSSATGLFQFIDQTWLEAVRQYGSQHGLSAEAALVVRRDGHLTVDAPNARQRILDLRKNPEIASALAGDHLRGISDKLGLTLGRPPDAAETYLGHLLGSGGASQLLEAVRTTPNQAAGDLLPAAARANSALFAAPDGTQYTVTQFMQHLRDRVGRAYASLGVVMPAGPINLAQTQPAPGGANQIKIAAAPHHSRQPIEREALANLTEVFTRLDTTMRRGQSAVRHHGKSQNTLPAALMTTLRGTPAGKVV
jgi:hypothetical protein